MNDDNTPFLCDKVNGKAVWRVEIQNWLPQTQSVQFVRNESALRTWGVLLDPTTGVVLKLKSRWPKGVPLMLPTVRADVAAWQMIHAGREKYVGFPSHAPRVSFYEALKAIEARGFAMADAKQIVADYVLWSEMDNPPKPVWAITFRGVPPFRRYSGSTPAFQDQFRHIVDSETGEWLEGSNGPRLDPGKSAPYKAQRKCITFPAGTTFAETAEKLPSMQRRHSELARYTRRAPLTNLCSTRPQTTLTRHGTTIE